MSRSKWCALLLSSALAACTSGGAPMDDDSNATLSPGQGTPAMGAATADAAAAAPNASTGNAAGPSPAGNAGGGGVVGPSAGPGSTSGSDASAPRPGDAATLPAGPGSALDAGVVTPADGRTGGKPRLAISADFLNKTLSIFDIDKLKEGAKRADVLVGSVDLSKYSPGPLALGITPDGKTALVSISAGFLGAFIDVPAGEDKLLFVDIEKRAVVGELVTGKGPMGIVITPDGKRAFVGQFAESYFSVVNIEKRTFEKVSTGSEYNEELSIDDTGTVAILTYGPAGNVKTFSVADPRMNGQTTGLSSDAAGVAFFPGTKLAYLVQAPTALTFNVGGHNLVDVSNPLRPVASDNVRVNDAPSMYPVTPVAARKSVAFPETKDNMLTLTEMKLEGNVAKKAQSVPVGPAKSLAYGVAATPDGRVLLAVPGEHYVGVVDLATQKAFTVPWEVTMSGPNDIKMIP